MTYLLVGAAALAVGAVFYWFNANSPLQTPIPLVALPLGAVLFIIGLARVLP